MVYFQSDCYHTEPCNAYATLHVQVQTYCTFRFNVWAVTDLIEDEHGDHGGTGAQAERSGEVDQY